MESDILNFIAQNWQIVFLYSFKYLKDMAETLKILELDFIKLRAEHEIILLDYTKRNKS